MQNVFIRKGHGYTDPRYLSPGMTVCTAFDGFTVIAEPLGGFSNEDRERRVWKRSGASFGVTTGSHAIKLATEGENGRGLFILMHHSGGREVLSLYAGPDWRAVRDAFLAMDERTLYAVLYSIWETADNARRAAERDTRTAWARAFLAGLIRKRRSQNKIYVEIETAEEKEWRTSKSRRAAA